MPPSTYLPSSLTTKTITPVVLLFSLSLIQSIHHVQSHIDIIHDVIVYRSIRNGQNHYSQIYAPSTFNFDPPRPYVNLYLPPLPDDDEGSGSSGSSSINGFHWDLCSIPKSSITDETDDYDVGQDGNGDGGGNGRKLWDDEKVQQLFHNNHQPELKQSNDHLRDNIVKFDKDNTDTNNNNKHIDLPAPTTGIRGMFHPPSQQRTQRTTLENKRKTYRRLPWFVQPTREIALLVWNSHNCSLQQMARNAMQLNKGWGAQNHTQISYLVVYDPERDIQLTEGENITIATYQDDEFLDFYNMDNDDNERIDIPIVYIQTGSVVAIKSQMNLAHVNWYDGEYYHLTKESFYEFENPERNTWAFNVLFMQIGSSSHSHLEEWRWIYVIITAVLALPILRTCCMIYFSDKRFVLDRNERGWIVGFHMERIYLEDIDGDLFDFPIHLKETLNKNQVEQLPIIEYNVSNLKQTIKKYYGSNPWLVSHGNDDDDDDNAAGPSENNDDNDVEPSENPENNVEENEEACADKVSGTEMKSLLNEEGQSDKIGMDQKIRKDEEEAKCEETKEESKQEEGEEDSDSDFDTCSFIDRAYAGCTSCHICLADYEQGENLLILPRCGHLFHYDCLLPWLTEHKSHCPLCKVDVMQYENNDTASMAVLP